MEHMFNEWQKGFWSRGKLPSRRGLVLHGSEAIRSATTAGRRGRCGEGEATLVILTRVRIYTKKGDDGTTGLLYGGRISKAHPAAEAYGTVDEAVAALGSARALAADPDVAALILRLQRELFVVGADLATNPDARAKLKPGVSLVTADMTDSLESLIDRTVEAHPLPQAFIVPGANPLSAALDVARSSVRRAERRCVELREAGGTASGEVLRYLNRLSDLLFVVARWQAGGDEALTHDA